MTRYRRPITAVNVAPAGPAITHVPRPQSGPTSVTMRSSVPVPSSHTLTGPLRSATHSPCLDARRQQQLAGAQR